jgi:hypothetical protein
MKMNRIMLLKELLSLPTRTRTSASSVSRSAPPPSRTRKPNDSSVTSAINDMKRIVFEAMHPEEVVLSKPRYQELVEAVSHSENVEQAAALMLMVLENLLREQRAGKRVQLQDSVMTKYLLQWRTLLADAVLTDKEGNSLK